MTETGRVLKEERLKKDITQSELAEKIGLTSPQYISNVERGLCPISPTLLRKACKVLQIRPEALIDACIDDYRSKFTIAVKG